MEEAKITPIPVIKRYSTREMAPFFEKSARQVRRELANMNGKYGKRIGQRWSPVQVKMIFDDFGIIYQEIQIAA
jgi:hypothetical protein